MAVGETERELLARVLLAQQRDALRAAKALEDIAAGVRKSAAALTAAAQKVRSPNLPDVGKDAGPCGDASGVVESR